MSLETGATMIVSRTWFRPVAAAALVGALCLPLVAAGKPPLISPGNGTLYVGVFPNHFKVIDEATGKVTGTIPYGVPVPGKPGFVTSPYSPGSGYIDVRGFPPNSEAKDPYSGKIFRVP